MMSAPHFTVDVFQNEYLPDEAREVNAIVTVTSAGSVADGANIPGERRGDRDDPPPRPPASRRVSSQAGGRDP